MSNVQCAWCGEEVILVGGEWACGNDSTTCPNHIEGCPACDDGDEHPHEPAMSDEFLSVADGGPA